VVVVVVVVGVLVGVVVMVVGSIVVWLPENIHQRGQIAAEHAVTTDLPRLEGRLNLMYVTPQNLLFLTCTAISNASAQETPRMHCAHVPRASTPDYGSSPYVLHPHPPHPPDAPQPLRPG
jgi:hypothetical protein